MLMKTGEKLQVKEFWMLLVRKLKSHSRLLELMPGWTIPIAADALYGEGRINAEKRL